MTRNKVSAIAFVFASVFAAQAMAADSAPVTREQVKAELAEAVRNGNMIVGESGQRMNQIFPHDYAVQNSFGITRAEVRAELAEAVEAGNVIVGQGSKTLSEINPHDYPVAQNRVSKSRAQVRTELAEAAAGGQLDRRIEA